MNKEDFLKLALNQQKRYVEQYPQTSHRFLIKGADTETKADSKAVPVGAKKKTQEVALRAKEASKQVRDPNEDIFARRQRFDESKSRDLAIRKDIRDLNQTNVGAITPASLKAIDTIQTHEVRAAAENISKNKKEIVSAVKAQAEKQPNMYGRGLDTIRRIVGRETEPKELSVTERYAAERSITSIATMCMLGAGILAFGMAGAPMGVIAGRVLFDMWMRKGDGQHLAKDLDELRSARKRKAKMKRHERQAEIAERDGLAYNYDTTEGGSRYGKENDEAAETAKRLEEKDELRKAREKKKTTAQPAKSSKKSRQLAAASSFDPDEHEDTINLVVEQVADILKYQSVADLQEHRDDMFKTTAASANQLEYLLTLALCHSFEPSGEGLTFKSGDLSALRSICQNTLGMNLESYSKGVYNYTKENCLVSFGRTAPDTYYIRSIGPLR